MDLPITMMQLPFAHLNLRVNPFGEPRVEERAALAVVDLPELRAGDPVQFVGESGHGKTTHLLALLARNPGAVYERLQEGEDRYAARASGAVPLLLDEAQRLRPQLLLRLFSQNRTLALGTHDDLSRFSDRPLRTVRFAGLTLARLRAILARRIEWARRGPGPVPVVSDASLQALLDRHASDVRAIEGHLYESFQSLRSPAMSKCDLSISLAKPDRAYAPGEMVRVKSPSPSTVPPSARTSASLFSGGRTGGEIRPRGTRTRQRLFDGEWSEGEEHRYPFEFQMPAGPATYHGHYLNVDHYLTARADLPWASDPKAETEILLVPGTLGRDGSLGRAQPATAPAARSRGASQQVVVTLASVLVLAALGVAFFRGGSGGWTNWQVLLPLVLVAALVVVGSTTRVRRHFAQGKLGRPVVELSKADVRPGEKLSVQVTLDPKGPLTLSEAYLELIGKEVVVSGSGTNETTHVHEIHSSRYDLMTGSREVVPGVPTLIQRQVEIPGDLPPSFEAENNSLTFMVRVHLGVQGWADWRDEFPLGIRP